MTVTWWSLFLAAFAGILLSLALLLRPDLPMSRVVAALALAGFVASGALALVVVGQT